MFHYSRLLRCCVLFLGLVFLLLPKHVTQAHPDPQDEGLPRPVLSQEQTFGTEHFLLHYTTVEDSVDAVDPTDADGSGAPDYIELVAGILENVYEFEVEASGWAVPPSDLGVGGDDRIDVYFEELLLFGIAGYVSDQGGFVRDNPNSADVERSAASSFMSLDNDYAEASDPDLGLTYTPTELVQATVAHEFNHILQMGYDSLDIHSWLYEATATWIEDEVYDDVNDGLYYIDEVFFSPDTCLVASNSDLGYGLRWYGSWLFLRHLSEQFGPEIVENIWAQSRQLNGFDAIDAALAPFSSTLERESLNYATRNLLQAYEEGDLYRPILLEGTARSGETFQPDDGVQSLGADYIKLPEEGLVSIELLDNQRNLTARLVGLDADGDYTVVNAEDKRIITNLTLYDEAYLIVHNNERIAEASDCTYIDYTVDIRSSQDISTAAATSGTAMFFQQPVDEPILDGGPPPFIGLTQGEEERFVDSPSELEPNFETIIPANVPAGYGFDYGYLANPDDFGDNQQYYLPSGEIGVSYDYVNSDGDWLGIIQSESPYLTIDDYLDDRSLIPETGSAAEQTSIQGYAVLLEDISNAASPYFSGTVIIDDLFIVVDSNSSADDVFNMIEALINAYEQRNAPPSSVTVPPLPQPVDPTASEMNPNSNWPMPRNAPLWFGLITLAVVILVVGLGVIMLLAAVVVSSRLAAPTKRMPAEVAASLRTVRQTGTEVTGE